MKKMVLVAALLVIGLYSAFAEAAYKNFTWGMTSEQVKKIEPYLIVTKRVEMRPLNYIALCAFAAYHDLLVSTFTEESFAAFYRVVETSGTITRGIAGGLMFFFMDNKLIAVRIPTSEAARAEVTSAEFTKQYGSPKLDKTVAVDNNGQPAAASVWEKANNIAVYLYGGVFHTDRTGLNFIDAKWFNALLTKAGSE
jgi:hypothetical protein